MPLTLSTEDVTRLQSALTTLLSPLDSTTLDGWGVASMTAVQVLLGADRAVMGIPNEAAIWSAVSDPEDVAAIRDHTAYYNEVDVVLRHRRRELGLEVYQRDMLYRPGELGRDELYNDGCVPNGLHDTLGMGVGLPESAEVPACIHFYHERASTPEFGQRGVELLQLLLPAFKAGIHTHRRLGQHRAALLRLLDTLDAGLEIFDERGAPLHQNAALGSLLEADPEAQRVRDQIPRIALAVSGVLRRKGGILDAPAPLGREVRTGAAIYQLRGLVIGQALLGPEVTIAVAVERVTPEPISNATLMERHGLTPREVEVARRLGEGDSSAQIAQLLGISRYTARHHTENVMRKLDVRSRAAVAARLTIP